MFGQLDAAVAEVRSLDVDALTGVDVPAGAANMGKASMEMSLDMRFSHHGEAFPQITAPPVGP